MRIGALLRIEVERAFKSRMFWLMLLLGIVITGIEFVIAPLRYSKDIIGTFDEILSIQCLIRGFSHCRKMQFRLDSYIL